MPTNNPDPNLEKNGKTGQASGWWTAIVEVQNVAFQKESQTAKNVDNMERSLDWRDTKESVLSGSATVSRWVIYEQNFLNCLVFFGIL